MRLPDLVVAHPSACFESADFRVTISLLPKRKINSAQRAVRKLRAVLWPHIGAARFVAARLVSSSRRNMSSEYRGSRNVGGQHLPQFCDRKCGEDALEAGISLELPRLRAGSYRHEALELSERWHKIGGQTRHRTNGVLSDESVVPWPASKRTTNHLINRNFVVSENREYHQLYQAKVSQFRFESASD